MTLSLSSEELQQVRACWNNVQTNNRYHKDQFISRLFSNLLAANSDLRSFFKSDVVIREHSMLFNDMFNYVVIYLDNVDRLNRFLSLFLKENHDIILKIDYLEPMGTALIQTFRQWLGNGLFNSNMEGLWVQIYIYLANNILVYIDDDSSSIESDGEIQALNIKREPSAPMTPVSPVLQQVEEEEEDLEEYSAPVPDLSRKQSLQVNIKSNDRYRGFRRNDSDVVAIEPAIEPAITPRSPRRVVPEAKPTVAAKFNNLKPRVVYDSDEEEQEKGFGFDPRTHKKKRSKDINFAQMEPVVPVEPVEVYNYKEKELPEINEKPSELEVTMSVDSDNSSSIYNSDHSEPSSHDNTLSLHNSHYSDGTEGTEPMSIQKLDLRSLTSNESAVEPVDTRVFSKNFSSRQTSISSVEPEFYGTKKSHSSIELQKSIQLSQRASLGFMRSSFVLKKEIESLGYNKPENVFVKPPTIPAASASPKSLSTASLTEEDHAYDLLNSFMPITDSSKAKYQKFTASCSDLNAMPKSHPNLQRHSQSVTNFNAAKHNKYAPMKSAEANASIRPSNTVTSHIVAKRSFRDKFKSLFGSAKEPKKISAPLETTYSTNKSVPSTLKTSHSNVSTSRISRISSHTSVAPTRSEAESKDKVLPMRRYSKMASVTDLQSVNTVASNESTSGFSFFSRRKSTESTRYSTRGDRHKNKYNVSKTPYDVFAQNKLIFSKS